MTCGLVHASYSLPEWQAVKLTFFAPRQGFNTRSTGEKGTNFRIQRKYLNTTSCKCLFCFHFWKTINTSNKSPIAWHTTVQYRLQNWWLLLQETSLANRSCGNTQLRTLSYCVVLENIHTPPTEGIGNSLGVEGSQKPKNLSKCMKLDLSFQRGGECKEKCLLWGRYG